MKNKIIDIIGFPIDLGAGRRGVDMGPSALRIAHLQQKIESLGYNVHDSGDVAIEIMEMQEVENPKLKYLHEILRASEELAEKVEHSLSDGHFPLCIGGDHSMALGTIAGIAAHCKKNDRKLGVIWIDAHTDMNTDKTTPSGNIHGMPLSASMGYGHETLVSLHGLAPKVQPENVVVIGARSIDNTEKEIIRKSGAQVFTMAEVDRIGIHRIASRVLKKFKNQVDHLHVSFDVDGLDPALAPGVGTPVMGGLSYREAHTLMETIAECNCMSSFEISEVNPILDMRNQSADIAVELTASAFGKSIL